MSSSFPRHGAKIRIKTQSERTKNTKPEPRADCKLAKKQNIERKNKKKPRADCKLAQKQKYRINIYMTHEQV